LDWFGVTLLALAGALAALLEALLVPFYIDGVIAPVAVALAVASNLALPWLAGTLVPRTSARLAPFGTWLIVVIVFAVVTRPEGDVILPGSPSAEEYVTYGVLLGGALVGAVTQVWLNPPPASRVSR
jgi:hypothetical protein